MGFSSFIPEDDDSNANNPNGTGSGGIISAPPGIIPGIPPSMMPTQGGDTALELLINYNKKFKSSTKILFRDEIVKQILSTLIGKNKPNTILVGPAGVGKTKIVEDIARMLENDDPLITATLKGYTIYELPLSNIVADSGIVGQVEGKVKAVVEFIEDPKNKAILFIDEIHQLVDTDKQTYGKIAQILKPALARGDMRTIGATTAQEAKMMNNDPALNRRFSRIIVDELTKTQTIEILEQSKSGFFAHYKNQVTLNSDIFENIVNLADEYRPAGSHRPDNAITLLDRAIGDTIINHKANIIQADASGNQVLSNALKSIKILNVTEQQIKSTALRLATGNSTMEQLDTVKLTQALARIKGQKDVIDDLVYELRKFDANLFPKTKPLTMMFVGPSGVGKTEVTRIISQQTMGLEPIILNMTEFHDATSINRIIGAPAGYVGSDSNAELPFDILLTNPYQVILLDEFEKCDRAVQTLFMRVFDEGELQTNRGDLIDFSKTIIIVTTNAGYTTNKKGIGFGDKASDTKITKNATDLSRWFDIALLNRFTKTLEFNSIDKETYTEIVRDVYRMNYEQVIAAKPRVKLCKDIPDDKLRELVEKSYRIEFGARPAEKIVRQYIMEQIL